MKQAIGHVPEVTSQPSHLPSKQSADNVEEALADQARPALAPTSFGGGLKRPLDVDQGGNPVIQQRKRHKPAKKRRIPIESISDSDSSTGSEWGGLSSTCSNTDDSLEPAQAAISSDETSEVSNSSDEDSPGPESEDESGAREAKRTQRISAFKAWVDGQRNAAAGFVPSRIIDIPTVEALRKREQAASSKLQRPESTAQIPNVTSTSSATSRKIFHIPVSRPVDVEVSRQELPVVAKEQEIMETVFANDVVILSGATGSGKTTQVPQFLFEAGFGNPDSPNPGMIGVTQPRRVAAVSMAQRVAHELGNATDRVSHQVRFDSTVGTKTAIKFMTDGILLREVSQDFTLSKYSVVIVDEAHERSTNTDILIGMLSRIVETRRKLTQGNDSTFKPLKLIIMSATLRISEFRDNKDLFRSRPPPVVDVEGKQYTVNNHFARRTARDYVEDAFQKVSRGHRKLPPGGMLVFLTGQNEIEHVERKLRSAFKSTANQTSARPKSRVSAQNEPIDFDDLQVYKKHEHEPDFDFVEDVEDEEDFLIAEDGPAVVQDIHVLPLYSQLPSNLQTRVFQPPPDGSRLIVLATNVAETSLTIPNIRYVFDCGRQKVKRYSAQSGVASFEIDWISKASAQQRAGRAGRTGPGGHCYKLYSSAVYEDAFPDFTEPEISQTPVEGVVLSLKSIGIPDVTRFPFPTPLSHTSLRLAEQLLRNLCAFDPATGRVTSLGKQMSLYPISPRLSRMLVLGQSDAGLLAHAITLIAALSCAQIFIPEATLGLAQDHQATGSTEDGDAIWTFADTDAASKQEQRRKEFATFHAHASRLDKTSDAMKALTTFVDFTSNNSDISAFRTHTRTKALQEASQLRSQLTSLVNVQASLTAPQLSPSARPTLPNPTQVLSLRRLIAAGYITNIVQRADLTATPPSHSRNATTAIKVPFLPLFAAHTPSDVSRATYAGMSEDDKQRLKYVYLHPSSVLARCTPAKLPRFLVYSHLSSATPQGPTNALPPRTRVHPLAPVDAATILELVKGTPLLAEGKPVGRIETLSRSGHGEERRAVWCTPLLRGSEGVEWPLAGARRIVQKRVRRVGWVLDE